LLGYLTDDGGHFFGVAVFIKKRLALGGQPFEAAVTILNAKLFGIFGAVYMGLFKGFGDALGVFGMDRFDQSLIGELIVGRNVEKLVALWRRVNVAVFQIPIPKPDICILSRKQQFFDLGLVIINSPLAARDLLTGKEDRVRAAVAFEGLKDHLDRHLLVRADAKIDNDVRLFACRGTLDGLLNRAGIVLRRLPKNRLRKRLADQHTRIGLGLFEYGPIKRNNAAFCIERSVKVKNIAENLLRIRIEGHDG